MGGWSNEVCQAMLGFVLWQVGDLVAGVCQPTLWDFVLLMDIAMGGWSSGSLSSDAGVRIVAGR